MTLLTETQAREKWCPEARIGRQSYQNHCIGARCSHWRWSPRYKYFGHCGLSGAPELRRSLIWRVLQWIGVGLGLAAIAMVVVALAFA